MSLTKPVVTYSTEWHLNNACENVLTIFLIFCRFCRYSKFTVNFVRKAYGKFDETRVLNGEDMMGVINLLGLEWVDHAKTKVEELRSWHHVYMCIYCIDAQ